MEKLVLKAVMRTIIGLIIAVAPSLWVFAGSANEQIAADASGVAIKGYDTVAYFTEGRVTKGDPEFMYSWRDAHWYFTSARHREMFAADLERSQII